MKIPGRDKEFKLIVPKNPFLPVGPINEQSVSRAKSLSSDCGSSINIYISQFHFSTVYFSTVGPIHSFHIVTQDKIFV